MAVDLKFLAAMPYFRGVSMPELETIGKLIVERTAARNDVLIFEGDTAKALYFVVFGVLKAFKTSADGKEQILSIIRPKESFNDVSVFDNGHSPVSIQALGAVTLYEINKIDLEAVIQKYPRLARNIMDVLAGRMRHLISLVEDLSFRHVIGRVAKILLDNAGDGTGTPARLTQQDMAAIAGTAREVVGRSLKALEEEGIIKMDRHRIIIRDKKALNAMVGSSI